MCFCPIRTGITSDHKSIYLPGRVCEWDLDDSDLSILITNRINKCVPRKKAGINDPVASEAVIADIHVNKLKYTVPSRILSG